MSEKPEGKSIYIKDGYQPSKSYEKGYQPAKIENGYKPTQAGSDNPTNPPASGSGETKKGN